MAWEQREAEFNQNQACQLQLHNETKQHCDRVQRELSEENQDLSKQLASLRHDQQALICKHEEILAEHSALLSHVQNIELQAETEIEKLTLQLRESNESVAQLKQLLIEAKLALTGDKVQYCFSH